MLSWKSGSENMMPSCYMRPEWQWWILDNNECTHLLTCTPVDESCIITLTSQRWGRYISFLNCCLYFLGYGPLFIITKFQLPHSAIPRKNLVPTYVSHMYFSEYTWSFWLIPQVITEHKSTSATPSLPVTKCRFTSCLLDPRDLLSLWSACVKGLGLVPFNPQNPGNLNGCHGRCLSIFPVLF